MEEKRKPIIRQPCAISTVSKLCSLENRQVTKPGAPTCTPATASLRGPDERAHASRPFQGPNPAFQGGELRRRTRRRPGARLGCCGCGPAPPPPARPLSGRRSAPHRDRGLRDPVLRPARPRRSIPRPRCAPRAGERRWPWGEGGRGAPGAGLSPRALASRRARLGRRRDPRSGRPRGSGVVPLWLQGASEVDNLPGVLPVSPFKRRLSLSSPSELTPRLVTHLSWMRLLYFFLPLFPDHLRTVLSSQDRDVNIEAREEAKGILHSFSKPQVSLQNNTGYTCQYLLKRGQTRSLAFKKLLKSGACQNLPSGECVKIVVDLDTTAG